MLHKKIRIPIENSMEIMTKFGSLHNYIEFEDLNKEEIDSQKPYYQMIQRCDEIEAIFKYLDNILLDEFDLKYEKYHNFEYFKLHLDEDISYKEKKFNENYFDLVENEIVEDYQKIKEQIRVNKSLFGNYLSLLEQKYVLEKASLLFSTGEIRIDDNDEIKSISNITNDENNDNNNFKINYIAGFCKSEDRLKISKGVFRKGKYRAMPYFFEFEVKERSKKVQEHFRDKLIYLIWIQGDYIINRIKDILILYNCTMFDFKHNTNLVEELKNINQDIEEKNKLNLEGASLLKNLVNKKVNINNNDNEINEFNFNRNNLSTYALYRMYFKMQKYIYVNLNKFKEFGQFYMGEVWIPEVFYPLLVNEIKSLANNNERILLPQFEDFVKENGKTYRTFFRTNEFTVFFQEIVNTYGVPRYKEANPGLFTIITFPFLFGIMFGDIGHGTLLLLLSIYIIHNTQEISNSNSILKNVLPYKYFMLLMGIFSLFCGIIYNDFMGIPFSFFNSCYQNDILTKTSIKQSGCVYPVGMDPKWYASHNELSYFNSFKMKLSVIVGVLQMLLGIVLRGLNNLYYKDSLGFYFEFIPQIIFFNLIFVYMISLIVIKWLTDYHLNLAQAPSIITILMNLALKNGSVEGRPVWGTVIAEERVNKIFFYTSVLCIPIILLVKPIILIIRNNKSDNEIIKPPANNNLEIIDINYHELFLEQKNDDINKSESMTDIFVHQIIETIEFVLGCISNTASYLRLWALSLAHGQLSKIFFEKTILLLSNYNFVMLIIGYFFFANITISVLMGMDLMEAGLHTLRLHWVEFQNKFFYADGVIFQPFSFKILFDNE